MPQPLAIWNSSRDVWEATGAEATTCLFCGHSDVYSETFTTSGMTRSGVAYALPTWAPPTAGSVSSSSPDDDELLGTPTSRMWKGAGPQGGPTQIRNKARGLIEAQVMDLLPTPVAQPSGNSPEEHLRKKPGRAVVTDLAIIAENGLIPTGGQLLPTPSANVGTNGGSQHPDKRRAGNHQPSIQDVAEHVLLPTVTARLGQSRGASHPDRRKELNGKRAGELDEVAVHVIAPTTDWGPYAPAIHRWEHAIGQPAPSPTEPNKAGKPRLSPRFTEWMMGVPAGWITGTPGVSRNDQLKACGNGVVPAQAAAAIKDMLRSFQ